ncbi:MAG TPA: hypothetical protein VFF03_03055 [Rhodocyclaceae bacterium]|nr:hypothetical protein [Rhodocyclaceae bacterium]
MGCFKSEQEFWAYYKRFNAICGGTWQGWKPTQARSRHEDLFGLRILPGQMFFRKQAGGDGASELKLSLASMEKILLIVMVQNRSLNELGERIARAQREAAGPGPGGQGAQVPSLEFSRKPN